MKPVVNLRFDMETRKTLDLPRLLKEWPARAKAFRGYFTYLAAKYVLDQMLERIPKKDEWKPYRMGLAVGQVAGADPENAMFAVFVDPRHRKVRKLDVQKSLVFIRPRRKMRKPKKEVALLERYNPWTYETLPFTPSKGDAIVVNKKSTQTAVDRVTRQKKRVLKKFNRELSRIGHRSSHKKSQLKVTRRLKKVPDVVFAALKLEFGLGTDKAKPHWRPAIRKLIRSGLREFRRSHHTLTYAMTRSSFQGWRKWPPRTRHRVRMQDARLFKNFQQRLGIRID